MTKNCDNHNTTLRKPSILFNKMVFKLIIETKSKEVKFRTLLYKNLDTVLKHAKQSHDTYRTWFSDPNRIPNKGQEFDDLLADALIATLLQQKETINTITEEIIKYHENEVLNR